MAGVHSSARYLGADFLRLLSYRYQLVYATRAAHASVLVIGKGDGLVPGFLRSLGANVLTADINRTLRPDIISDVRQLSLVDAAVDMSMCCQVLEHLPFDQFRAALTELRRVTRLHLILSLPDVRRHWRVRLEAGSFVIDCQGSLPRFPGATVSDCQPIEDRAPLGDRVSRLSVPRGRTRHRVSRLGDRGECACARISLAHVLLLQSRVKVGPSVRRFQGLSIVRNTARTARRPRPTRRSLALMLLYRSTPRTQRPEGSCPGPGQRSNSARREPCGPSPVATRQRSGPTKSVIRANAKYTRHLSDGSTLGA